MGYSITLEVEYDYDIEAEILQPAISAGVTASVDYIGKNGWPVVKFTSDRLLLLLEYLINGYHQGDEDAAIGTINNFLKAVKTET